MCPEFDNMMLELNEYELTCFSLRASTFNASQIEFFIGTAFGKLFYFYAGWLKNDKENIHDNADEGPVTVISCYQDIVSWATPKNIRVIHFAKK